MLASIRTRLAILVAFVSFAALAAFPVAICHLDLNLYLLLHNRDLAEHHPDEFSWKVFAQIARPWNRSTLQRLNDGQTVDLYSTEWETWAENEDIFPTDPDPSNPPRWEDRNSHGDKPKHLFKDPLTRPAIRQDLSHLTGKSLLVDPFPETGCDEDAPVCLEVRHNKPDFDSIVKNALWYQEGLKRAFSANPDGSFEPGNVLIARESIEIKAGWRRWQQGDDASRYHIYQDQSGNVYLLVALHIMTKALHKWTWSTFEQVDNSARCDSYGCRDNYGSTEPYVPPNPGPSQGYHSDALSPAVLRDLKGLPNEWKFYRLKGSQTEFMADGEPTLLGNSILEKSVRKHTASCISCHARARINSDGGPATDRGFLPYPSSPNGSPQSVEPCRPIGFIWSVMLAKPAHAFGTASSSSPTASLPTQGSSALSCNVQ